MKRNPVEVVRFTVEVLGHTCLLMYLMTYAAYNSSEAFALIVEEATSLDLDALQATVNSRAGIISGKASHSHAVESECSNMG